MILNYLRLAFRTFARNKAAFLINLAGMSIALGCCITAYVNYEFNVAFDKIQQNAGNIYRIGFWKEGEGKPVPYGVTPMPVAALIQESLDAGDVSIQYVSKTGQFRIGTEMFEKEVIYAQPEFLNVFTIEKFLGPLSLEDKGQILISDKLAVTYFGKTDVVGLPLTQIFNGEPREFVVGGVFKAFPANSSFRFELLTAYDNYFNDPEAKSKIENDWSRWVTTFLFIRNPATVERLSTQLQQYIKVQNDARPDLRAKTFYIEPFIGMASRAVRERNQGHWLASSMPPAAVIAPIAMAGFLLLVACFNFMNNAIALAGNRLKEIGIRKVIGGRRKELIFQFLSETLVFCMLALSLGLVWAEFLTDGWNGMWAGLDIAVRYKDNLPFFAVLFLLIFLTAMLSGGYPAFYISAFKPIQILRGTTKFGGATLLSKSLLIFQFSISLAAIIFALAFYFNSRFQREYDLGYSWRSVVQVPLENSAQYEQLKHELEGSSLVKSIGGSEHHIYANSYKAAARSEKHDEKEVDMLNVGDEYFETVNVRMIAGRKFEKDQASDIKESIIVNEEFLRSFGLTTNALGQRILLNDSIPVYIIGVVKDVYLRALFEPLTPVAFRYGPKESYRYLVASTDPDQLVETNDVIKSAWSKLFPNTLYTGRLMEQRMVMALEHFDSVVILYTFLGLVAIIMSISGMYSLVSLSLQKRTKELGLRKILGASIPQIALQSSKLFLIIMAISLVLGSLLGSVMVNALMATVWEYYVAINFTVLSLAILILVMITVATIGYKIRKVTVTNPVESLRYE